MKPAPPRPPYRLGIDLGGTKLAGIVFDADDNIVTEARQPSPRSDYRATIEAIRDLVATLEAGAGIAVGLATVGIGMPGSISPATGLVQNANSTWLNGQALDRDLRAALGRDVRLANDANCFVLSEARDGAATGARSVFGVILGTGCGGAFVIDGRLQEGRHAMGGEWGHCPLPWATADEHPGPRCWCGRDGCLETWISGSGMTRDHLAHGGRETSGEAIVAAAIAGDHDARATLDRHASRLARGLAMIANILDPDVIVLGGGLSLLTHLYADVPPLMARYMFSDRPRPDIRPPRFGDASGVRGAARLWDAA